MGIEIVTKILGGLVAKSEINAWNLATVVNDLSGLQWLHFINYYAHIKSRAALKVNTS